MKMNYEETLEYLLEKLPMFQRIGPSAVKKDLTNTIRLLDFLGNPHQHFKTLHVAGTNGKGSVSHILAATLRQQGYSVGIYTSPHYIDIRERIKVNGQLMERDFLTNFVHKVSPLIDEIQPSYFELLVAMAFDYFKYSQVDWGVVEVGLGGRLDSTNVILPELSVITNISYDHQNLLGDTLGEIAFEKAGIIKDSIPVVIGEKQDEIAGVFEQKAMQHKSRIIYASDHYDTLLVKRTERNMEVLSRGKIDGDLVSYKTDLTGAYQLKNLNTALSAVKVMESNGYLDNASSLFVRAVSDIRRTWNFMGRMQILKHDPLVIADSAHNEAGMAHLLEDLKSYQTSQVHFIMGTVSDKDPLNVLIRMPKEGKYYFCRPNIPRGMDADILTEKALSIGLKGTSFSSVKEAYDASLATAKDDDVIVVCGSIFVVAELI